MVTETPPNGGEPSAVETPEEELEEEKGLGTVAELESLGPCKRRIRAKVPAEKVSKRLDESYRELRRTVVLPGFRPGRVPRRLLERRFGEEIESDLKDELLEQSFGEVVEAEELRLFGRPRFDNIHFEPGADFTYEAEVDVVPDFELGEYKGIEVEAEEVTVTDEEVAEQIDLLRNERGEVVAKPVTEIGPRDYVLGRYVLKRDGLELKREDLVTVVPQSDMIGGIPVPELARAFETWSREVASDDPARPLAFRVKIPEDYPDEVLRGEELDLEFFVDSVSGIEPHPLDDSLAKEHGVETLEELREKIRSELQEEKEKKVRTALAEQVLARLVEETPIELPEDFVERHRERAERLRRQELLAEGKSEEEVDREAREEGERAAERARRKLKETFILDKIAEKEKIYATEEEVELQIRVFASYYGLSPEEIYQRFAEEGELEEIRQAIRNAKVKRFLRDHLKVVRPGGSGQVPAGPEASGTGASDTGASEASDTGAPAAQGTEPPAETPAEGAGGAPLAPSESEGSAGAEVPPEAGKSAGPQESASPDAPSPEPAEGSGAPAEPETREA